jgi:hypothetical protein
MKVAQYEVLGSVLKELSVPDGTIDQWWQSLSGVRDQKPSVSIVPLPGRTYLLSIDPRHFIPSYLRNVPPGHANTGTDALSPCSSALS